MSETKQQPETPKEVIDNVFKKDTVFTFGLQELAMFEQALAPFQWMTAVLNNLKNTSASQGNTLPTYKEDYLVDEKGDFVLNQKGFPQLKPEFWEKHK